MECQQASEWLSHYFDHELSREMEEQVREHVQQCAKCSAELNAFATLGGFVACARTRAPSPENWSRIEAKLSEPRAYQFLRGFGVQRHYLMRGMVVALAASMLLVVSLRFPLASHEEHEHRSDMAALDYGVIMDLFAQKSSAVIDDLCARFDGREVAVDQTESLLGYRPLVIDALPEDIQLVSTYALKLPHCNCGAGNCTCGPTGCNCSASVCKRKDGTRFLVVEHCKSQNVSFGDNNKLALHDQHDVQLLRSKGGLAVSWIAEKRRLTGIGLKDAEEAISLRNALRKPTSSI